jgi:hypothetical protein
MVSCLPRSVLLITDPPRAVLPFVERWMYIDGTTSGYGLPELAAFLAAQAERSPINVVRFTRTPAKEAIRLYLPAAVSAQVHLLDAPRNQFPKGSRSSPTSAARSSSWIGS